MTDHEHLERACRRLLAWYPRKFRRENGQEILAVLLAGAPHGQRRPGLAEAADLIRSGLWLRLWPSVPRSARTVRAAVKLMYAGAAVSTVNLVILLALTTDIKGSASWLNTPFIPVSIAWSLAPLALWLWMARETGRGRNWARIVSTVLFGAATLDLTEVFGPPGIRLSLVPVIAGSPTVPVLYWLVGLAVVWLLWRPGLQRVLPAAGLHAGPAPGTDGRVRPSGADGRTRADQGTGAASGVSRVDLRARAGAARRAPGGPRQG
jgi:hypothetical protein